VGTEPCPGLTKALAMVTAQEGRWEGLGFVHVSENPPSSHFTVSLWNPVVKPPPLPPTVGTPSLRPSVLGTVL
jgi:hypothetical protein